LDVPDPVREFLGGTGIIMGMLELWDEVEDVEANPKKQINKLIKKIKNIQQQVFAGVQTIPLGLIVGFLTNHLSVVGKPTITE
jgi:hypothetical protein